MTQLNETTDIVIVGAGPTGLTAAVRLAQLGVPHVVLDAGAEPSRTSKAALVHASIGRASTIRAPGTASASRVWPSGSVSSTAASPSVGGCQAGSASQLMSPER